MDEPYLDLGLDLIERPVRRQDRLRELEDALVSTGEQLEAARRDFYTMRTKLVAAKKELAATQAENRRLRMALLGCRPAPEERLACNNTMASQNLRH